MTDDGPTAGWYDDPDDASRYRYWDGERWSEHRAPKTPSTPPPPPAPRAGSHRNSNAGLALGLSIGGILCCGPISTIGLVLGARELQAAKRGELNDQDRGLALAATIIGGIVTALLVLLIALLFAMAVFAGDPGPPP